MFGQAAYGGLARTLAAVSCFLKLGPVSENCLSLDARHAAEGEP